MLQLSGRFFSKGGMSMPVASINISVDSEIKDRAQEVFTSLGLDMSTAINNFLKQTIQQHGIPFDLPAKPEGKMPQLSGWESKMERADDFDAPLDCTIDPIIIQPNPSIIPQLGCMKGKIWMADDFDAPMEEFEEYM
jgi:DNA-damage-inducible protein J